MRLRRSCDEGKGGDYVGHYHCRRQLYRLHLDNGYDYDNDNDNNICSNEEGDYVGHYHCRRQL